MMIHKTIEFAKPAHEIFHWLHHLGGPGLIVLGLIDNSVIPVPGSMDALVIILSANQRKLWPYYALMATIGSVIGGYVTYRISFRQGKSAMEHRFSRKRIDKVTKTFEKWGFGAVLIPAMLPPPAPMVPFLIAAGAMQYSRNKFLAAPSDRPGRPIHDPRILKRLLRPVNSYHHHQSCKTDFDNVYRCGGVPGPLYSLSLQEEPAF